MKKHNSRKSRLFAFITAKNCPMKFKNVFSIVILLLTVQFSIAQVRLPQLIGDGMVLQRDAKINIWGWASPGEKVSIKV